MIGICPQEMYLLEHEIYKFSTKKEKKYLEQTGNIFFCKTSFLSVFYWRSTYYQLTYWLHAIYDSLREEINPEHVTQPVLGDTQVMTTSIVTRPELEEDHRVIIIELIIITYAS